MPRTWRPPTLPSSLARRRSPSLRPWGAGWSPLLTACPSSCRSGGLRPGEPEVLRDEEGGHLAQHDERPGSGPGRQGGLRHRAGLPIRHQRDLQPRTAGNDPTSWSPTPPPTPTWCSGCCSSSGSSYRPALADIPDQRLWRINGHASYGPFDVAARGKIDLDRIRKNRPYILRVVGSIHTGAVRAYDIARTLQSDGHPTPLGEAIASHGRIFKSLHVRALIADDLQTRHQRPRNLQEGRSVPTQQIFRGRKGELYQR